jgi:hypothetical protein
MKRERDWGSCHMCKCNALCRKLFRVIFFILVKKVVGTRKSLMGNSKLTVDAKKRMNMCFNVESRKW